MQYCDAKRHQCADKRGNHGAQRDPDRWMNLAKAASEENQALARRVFQQPARRPRYLNNLQIKEDNYDAFSVFSRTTLNLSMA